MGQIFGLGITHYPALSVQGNMTDRIKLLLADPALPERMRSLDNWPDGMRQQWGDGEGEAPSIEHRQAMIDRFRLARKALDEFQPDFCVI